MMCSVVAGAIHSLACIPASIQIAGFDKSLSPICYNGDHVVTIKSVIGLLIKIVAAIRNIRYDTTLNGALKDWQTSGK